MFVVRGEKHLTRNPKSGPAQVMHMTRPSPTTPAPTPTPAPAPTLVELLAAAIGAARDASEALADAAPWPAATTQTIAAAQVVLAQDPPTSEDDLDVLLDLVHALRSLRDDESVLVPVGDGMAANELTDRGRQVDRVCTAVEAARRALAAAADRWRAEGIVLSLRETR